MEKIVKGVHHFQKDVFSSQKALFERLEKAQEPEALFITCSDSRVDPVQITQSEPGDLFVLQNAGNIVPPYGAGGDGAAATIEYAIAKLEVRDIIVCGHSHCGAMTGLLDVDNLKNVPAVVAWLKHAESTRRIIEENYTHITDQETRVQACVAENVLVQLENLRTHPSVAVALSRKELSLHGWVYKFEAGVVFAYDPELDQFAPLKAPGETSE